MDILSYWPWLLLGLVVVLGVLTPLLRRTSTADKTAETWYQGPLPYRLADSLLSPAERKFYEVLRLAVGQQLLIAPKVRLLDLVYIPRGTENQQSFRNRVSSKHVDFVLCDNASLAPLLVVELDDASHERADRQERDAAVDAILCSVRLPILHIPTARQYEPQYLADQIRNALADNDQVARPGGGGMAKMKGWSA